MVNWAKPDVNSTKTTLPGEVQTGLDHAIKMDFTSDTNIPTGAIRFNTGKVAFESYNGSSFVRAFPAAGIISQGLFSSAPSGYLLCRGGTIGNASSGGTVLASANAEDLFIALWNNSANTELPVSGGRGASAAADYAANKTITLPDYRQRVAIGVSASGTGSVRGGTGGNIDHVHTITHTHDMGNHTHNSQDHIHTISSHFHTVVGSGADIAFSTSSSSSGDHNHLVVSAETVTVNPLTNSNSVAESRNAGNDFSYGIDNGGASSTPVKGKTNTSGAHGHSVTANAVNFSGRIGNVTSGVDGNSPQTTGAAGLLATSTPSTNTTGAASNSNSGSNNQASLAVDFIIKL